MGLIVLFRNISPPTCHKLYILEMTLFSLELEIAVDSDIKDVKESVTNIRDFKFQVPKKSLTTTGQPFPIHPEDFFPDEGRQDTQPSTLRSTWHQCLLDPDPDHPVWEPLGFSTSWIHDESLGIDTVKFRISEGEKNIQKNLQSDLKDWHYLIDVREYSSSRRGSSSLAE